MCEVTPKLDCIKFPSVVSHLEQIYDMFCGQDASSSVMILLFDLYKTSRQYVPAPPANFHFMEGRSSLVLFADPQWAQYHQAHCALGLDMLVTFARRFQCLCPIFLYCQCFVFFFPSYWYLCTLH